MNNQSNSIGGQFKIIISVGDESGIGPEIILKALFSKEIPNNIDSVSYTHLTLPTKRIV